MIFFFKVIFTVTIVYNIPLYVLFSYSSLKFFSNKKLIPFSSHDESCSVHHLYRPWISVFFIPNRSSLYCLKFFHRNEISKISNDEHTLIYIHMMIYIHTFLIKLWYFYLRNSNDHHKLYKAGLHTFSWHWL
jgi:hypothetical protein